jgi:hypothetical protein
MVETTSSEPHRPTARRLRRRRRRRGLMPHCARRTGCAWYYTCCGALAGAGTMRDAMQHAMRDVWRRAVVGHAHATQMCRSRSGVLQGVVCWRDDDGRANGHDDDGAAACRARELETVVSAHAAWLCVYAQGCMRMKE